MLGFFRLEVVNIPLFGYFYLDGRSSREFGLQIALKENDDTTHFGISRQNNIEMIPNSHKSYSMGSKLEPLVVPITMWSEKPLTRDTRIEMCNWLFQDDFLELYTEEDQDVIYYCKIHGDSERFLGIGRMGYVDLEMICDSPFAWSRPMVQYFNLLKELSPTMPMPIPIRNDSNYKNWHDFIVKISIPSDTDTLLSDLEFKIWNKTTTTETDAFVISSALGSFPLQKGENLQIDMITGDIYTDVGLTSGEPYAHRRKNTNKKFIELNYGVNEIEFTGNCELTIVTQFPVLK